MTSLKVWGKQMKTKTGRKYQLVQKVVMKPINYLTDYRQVEILKGTLVTVLGVHTLECLETNMALNGLWNLTQIITVKFNRGTISISLQYQKLIRIDIQVFPILAHGMNDPAPMIG